VDEVATRATFTITVEPGRTSLRTVADKGAVPHVALDAAMGALQAERAELERCPFHARAWENSRG